MPAVAEAHVFHGAPTGSPTDVSSTTVRFKQADDDIQDTNSPVPIPTAGTNYSWRKNFKLRCPVTGPDTSLFNLRFFSEQQVLGTDRNMFFLQAAVYVQGSAADESVAISAVNVDVHTTSTPKVVNAGEVFGVAETGDGTQDFVVLQVGIGPTAVAGNVDFAKGLTYRFDEI